LTPGIMICSEKDEGAFGLLTKGRELSKHLNMELSALVLGDRSDKEIESYFEHGAQNVLLISNADPQGLDAGTYAYILFEIAKENGPDVLLINSSRLGKETAGRGAQRLQAGCITDAIGLTSKGQDIIVDRYALGGNTISSEIIKTRKKVISVMPRTFEAQPGPVQGKIQRIDLKIPPRRVEQIERRKKLGESVNIESAETLVCVGKGMSNKEDLAMARELCIALKGELGCTRALSSDYHWISEDRMVGISGKRCKPKLHVSIGISGQIQHTVGISGSKLIVAINKDKEAPIFKIADYGIVGDLYQIVPKLAQKLKALGN
jgi:electron transfer flavoprotein alpha subunit